MGDGECLANTRLRSKRFSMKRFVSLKRSSSGRAGRQPAVVYRGAQVGVASKAMARVAPGGSAPLPLLISFIACSKIQTGQPRGCWHVCGQPPRRTAPALLEGATACSNHRSRSDARLGVVELSGGSSKKLPCSPCVAPGLAEGRRSSSAPAPGRCGALLAAGDQESYKSRDGVVCSGLRGRIGA